MIAGCYVLDLYCDNVDAHTRDAHTFPKQFTDELGTRARAAAKRAGWKLDLKRGTAICPKCVRIAKGGAR